MQKALLATVLSIFFVVFLLPFVAAHSPLGTGGNESISTATVIPDPTKSWALYAELSSDGDAQYYTFNITQGQRIHVMLYKSLRTEDEAFNPNVVLIGPRITSSGVIPSKITVPSGSNAAVISSNPPVATYEPFSPSSFYSLADEQLNAPASGTYYVVVYEQSNPPVGGHYGLAIGDRESYTLSEWVLIPFNLISIYQWEGQPIALIFAPMVATLIVGIILVTWRLRNQRQLRNALAWLASIAGLLFMGTGVTTLYQMLASALHVSVGAEAIITIIFVAVPLIVGFFTLRAALKSSDRANVRKRISLVVLGVVALFMWAGLIVGPVLAIAASVMPTRLKR